MNKYLNALLFGKKENRVLVQEALGVPDTLASLHAEALGMPHIAVVGGVLYIWDVPAQEWVAYQLIPFEILTLETVDETEYVLTDGNMIDMIVLKSAAADTVNIGSTPGGSEYVPPGVTLNANQWRAVNIQIIADGSDKTIYFSGFTDTALIKIYKRKLTGI